LNDQGVSLPNPPELGQPIVFYVDLPPEVQAIYRSQIENLEQALHADNSNINTWNDLGVQRMAIGDYQHAREIWEYVSAISPLNNVSFFNLGDLYHLYLKDYLRAEVNLLKSKENNPKYIPVYRALFNLYTLSYKQNTSAAEEILQEGIGKVPNNLDLLVLLAGYYKGKGDVENARLQYEKALVKAEELSNESMIGLLKEELQRL
jgi:tetratricopeptide (TPR) repeat protein